MTTTLPPQHQTDLHHAVDTICDAWPRVLADLDAIGYPKSRAYDGTPTGGHGAIIIDGEHVPATSVEIAALNTHAAVAWTAELHDVTLRVTQAAHPHTPVTLVPRTPDQLAPVLHDAVDRLASDWAPGDLIAADPASPNYRRDVFGLYRLADTAQRYWPRPLKKGDQSGAVTVGARTNTIETCGLCQEPVTGGRTDPIRRIDGQAYHGRSCWFTVTRQRQAGVTQHEDA